jgi:hypothetical protein
MAAPKAFIELLDGRRLNRLGKRVKPSGMPVKQIKF